MTVNPLLTCSCVWKNPSDLVVSVAPFVCLQCVVMQLSLMLKREWFFCCDSVGYENDLFGYSIRSLNFYDTENMSIICVLENCVDLRCWEVTFLRLLK